MSLGDFLENLEFFEAFCKGLYPAATEWLTTAFKLFNDHPQISFGNGIDIFNQELSTLDTLQKGTAIKGFVLGMLSAMYLSTEEGRQYVAQCHENHTETMETLKKMDLKIGTQLVKGGKKWVQ